MSFRSVVLASLLASYTYASCLHSTSKLQRRITEAGTVEVSKFGYTGLQGPLNWAGLTAENSLCATGTVQSPINIDESVATASETPKITIANVEAAEFENLGTTLEAIVNGTTEFGGATFNLKQFHFHTPSEHRINEEYFPLEMHMVHEAADGSGGITVLAVLFQLCAAQSSTQLLKAVTENIANVANPGSITETGALDFTQLITHLTTTPLRQYTGSLTTPPCAEGLTFLVTERPLPLDVETYNSLKSVIRFNSRFTQNIIGDSNLLSRNGGIDSVAAPAEGEDTAQEAPAEEGNLLVTEIAGEPTSVVATIVPRATPAAVENSRTKRRRGQQLSL